MSVIYEERQGLLTLYTKNTTYQMKIGRYGELLHLYYGKRAEGSMEYLLTYYNRGFSGNPYEAGEDRTYSLDQLPQEFPTFGVGDYRVPACVIQNPDGTRANDFRYESHCIRKGKYGLEGLPAVYADEEEAQTLKIALRDPASGVRAVLLYGVLPELDIITRSVQIVNGGSGEIVIEKASSACLDMVGGEYDLITFYGRHLMERQFQRMPLGHGIAKIASSRGTSSHQYNPVVILAEREAGERWGSCYGLVFVYSGGFQSETEKDQIDQTRVVMGLSENQLAYPLKPGETFLVPETIMTYSSEGLARLSQNLHRCIQKHVCRGPYRDAVRPILINSWEASYFDISADSLVSLAKEAAELGIELLVMDDGWFGTRDSDTCALGDWTVNEKKLGCTLGELAQRVNDLGMKFGIWIEPEMVSEDSELYRAHPDWAMAIPGRKPNRSRGQLVLDFSRKEAADHVFRQICSVLDSANIEYVKWDMNRSLAEVYSGKTDRQGRVLYDYMLGVYGFLERLIQRYPHILIEGCSGGGGRFDAGMLYYTPQIWCSDNTDAVDRVEIQYGTSFIYPASTVGAHVSAVPNHQTGRITSMKMRGMVAMAGTFGYELDLAALSEEEKQEIRRQNEAYRKFAPLIQNGRYYRLTDPRKAEVGAWMFVSEDQREALVCAVCLKGHGNAPVIYLRLAGLKASAAYREAEQGKRYWGAALMEAGLPVPVEQGEYRAYQWHLVEE